ncbi:guanylate kinase [Reichenbachiella versicolor]|uniref:guanylate kinase n=1 Tax=Reichenbachiella versicolor TaxID=1821036 RepID=UPI000D6E6B38|nr:guanylate kinase [Reichenbachiella versicolor]
MQSGKAFIFSAPSGSGKTTIVKYLLGKYPELEFSISAATRQKRPEEVNGKDYYFFSQQDFEERIKNDEFIEYEEVYEGSYYGTLKSEIDRIWAKGHHVIFDVDVKGGLNIKKFFGDKALAIFVKVPDMTTLSSRLKNRGTETPESLQKRIDKAEYEMSFEDQFDTTIVNDNLEVSLPESEKLYMNFLSK